MLHSTAGISSIRSLTLSREQSSKAQHQAKASTILKELQDNDEEMIISQEEGPLKDDDQPMEESASEERKVVVEKKEPESSVAAGKEVAETQP